MKPSIKRRPDQRPPHARHHLRSRLIRVVALLTIVLTMFAPLISAQPTVSAAVLMQQPILGQAEPSALAAADNMNRPVVVLVPGLGSSGINEPQCYNAFPSGGYSWNPIDWKEDEFISTDNGTYGIRRYSDYFQFNDFRTVVKYKDGLNARGFDNMARWLYEDGFDVWIGRIDAVENFGKTLSLDENGICLLKQLQYVQSRTQGQPIHIVGYSMGGLVTRASFEWQDSPAWVADIRTGLANTLKTIITLGSPHTGNFFSALFNEDCRPPFPTQYRGICQMSGSNMVEFGVHHQFRKTNTNYYVIGGNIGNNWTFGNEPWDGVVNLESATDLIGVNNNDRFTTNESHTGDNGKPSYLQPQGYHISQSYEKVIGLKLLEQLFADAEQRLRTQGIGTCVMSPGTKNGGIHPWLIQNTRVWIQDYQNSSCNGNNWGDGAIIYNPTQGKAHYIAGSYWTAYKKAVGQWNQFPGYPMNLEHPAETLFVQDFNGGTWGEAGIVGTNAADWISGKYWDTYRRGEVSGSLRLLNPVRSAIDTNTGGYSQYFERGAIHVDIPGQACVDFYNTSGATIETKCFPPERRAWSMSQLLHQQGQMEGDGWSVTVGRHQAGYMQFGPYDSSLPVGKHTAVWDLMVDNVVDNNVSIVTLDVYDATSGKVLASSLLTRKMWARPMTYEDSSVPFVLDASLKGHKIEFRAYWHGMSYVREREVRLYINQTFWGAKSLLHGSGRSDENGWSVSVGRDPQHSYMQYGPYTPLLIGGVHWAVWKLMVDNTTADNVSIATIEVYDSTTGSVLNSKLLTRRMWASPFTYQDFALPFTVPGSITGPIHHKIEFRVKWHGMSYVRQRSVHLQ